MATAAPRTWPGIVIVALIAASALFAGYESIQRLFHPQDVRALGWVAGAALDRVPRQRVGGALPHPGRAQESARRRWWPTDYTRAPMDSPPFWP